jgi:proton glutamate symport protein
VSLTARVLLGLIAGFLAGLVLTATTSPLSAAVISVAAPIGTIFVNLIRMTMLPLVVSMLIARIGALSADDTLQRTAGRAAVFAVGMLTASAVISLAVAAPLLALVQIDPAAPQTMAPQASPNAAPAGMPSIGTWIIDLVPQNVIKAAADGTILPVIVFALLFGIALSRTAREPRAALLRVVEGVADTMQRLVGWILELAPVGVFALAIPIASRLGLAAAGALLAYVALVVALTVGIGILVLYPTAIVWGSLSTRRFIDFCAPAQAVAFASRSSLAALPAMVESAERAQLAPAVAGFIIPLGASVFRVGGAVAQTVGVLFLARLYGAPLAPAQYAVLIVTVVLTTFAVPGVPGGSIIAMVPVLAAVDLPADGVAILLAVDAIPDMFRTTANVTGSMVVAAVASRSTAAPRSVSASSLR